MQINAVCIQLYIIWQEISKVIYSKFRNIQKRGESLKELDHVDLQSKNKRVWVAMKLTKKNVVWAPQSICTFILVDITVLLNIITVQ